MMFQVVNYDWQGESKMVRRKITHGSVGARVPSRFCRIFRATLGGNNAGQISESDSLCYVYVQLFVSSIFV